MNLLAGEIVDLLKGHDFGYPNVMVTRSFNASNKTYPRIVVRQMQSATLLRDADKTELEIIAFQFEVYAKDCVDSEGNIKSRDEVCDDISAQIDEIIFERYRFNHDDITEVKRYTEDVGFRLLRYSGVIDQFGLTYRSSHFPYSGYTYQNFY